MSPGIQKDLSHDTMREHLGYLQREIQITRPMYDEAQVRSSNLALEVEGFTKVMNLKIHKSVQIFRLCSNITGRERIGKKFAQQFHRILNQIKNIEQKYSKMWRRW